MSIAAGGRPATNTLYASRRGAGGVPGPQGRLVPLLHEYSLLRTKPRLLKRDVIVQVGELPSGKIGDEFEAFVRVTLGLDVSDQRLGEETNTRGETFRRPAACLLQVEGFDLTRSLA